MSADQWITFWGLVIAVAVGSYAVLTVFVAVGGLRDVREMFRRMSDSRDQD